ncbi:MAG: hypothetical protein GX568_04465 [Candidatus Gastranaerophilales bacterium]|nr:hypothetical protein [Candidatus Gastranaerophilales bacterium]
MKQEVQITFNKLLEINLAIKALLEAKVPNTEGDVYAEFQEKVEKLLSQKGEVIEKLQALKQGSESEFSALKQKEFSEIWGRIKELEAENLEAMQKLQAAISEELAGNKQHSRVISSYKYTKEVQPRLFDDSL